MLIKSDWPYKLGLLIATVKVKRGIHRKNKTRIHNYHKWNEKGTIWMLWFNDSIRWRWFFNLINTVITYLAFYIYIFKASRHYGSGKLTRIEPNQYENKNYYYYNFKTWFRGQSSKVHVTSWEGQHELTWVNVWIKYFSLKTWLGSQLEARFRSWVGRINLADLKIFYFFSKKFNKFLTHVLSQVDLSFWLGHVESILP